MSAVDELRASIPEAARDIKLNLQSVLQPGALTPAQRWGVAIASAVATRNDRLRDAILHDARAEVGEEVIDDALAAAALMAMNNVYYRFRHMMGASAYAQKPARLRMNRLAKPKGSRSDLELYSLAASAINGCEICVRSHEKAVREAGLSEDQVNDAVRVAATIHAAAVALECADLSTAA
jgi:alkyl hydroperoxide reductase subunit D